MKSAIFVKTIKFFSKLGRGVKNFGGNVQMSFLIEDDKLLQKYSKIWNKVESER